MKYCSKCLMPDTKPYLEFNNDGVCNACQAAEDKQKTINGIDWAAREKDFEQIVLEAKTQNAPFYDALVPVSGGKDSITQVHRILKYNLRILAVNVDYGIKTEIGRQNLECISDMGADLIVYRPEMKLHKEMIRIGFEDFGDPDLMSHCLLHAYPLHVALRYQIPLVVLGENSASEYGGDKNISALTGMNRSWFLKYAANSGKDPAFMADKYNIPIEKLQFYDFPDELEDSKTKTIFTSSYFPWDSEKHLEIAKGYGFKSLENAREGTYRNYVGVDEKINRIHQYFKVLKFGYGRTTDHTCEDIRNGRLTREEAKELVRMHDLMPLSDYYVDDFIKFIGISRQQFFSIIEKFRNKEIWKKNISGKWYIPDHLEDSK